MREKMTGRSPGTRPKIPLIALGALLALMVMAAAACGSAEEGTVTGEQAVDTTSAANDRSALLAAESILQSAQSLQEAYYQTTGSYAATIDELKVVSPKINPKLEVVSGDANGYEVRITASDSNNTVLILRKSGEVVDHVDGNGNPW